MEKYFEFIVSGNKCAVKFGKTILFYASSREEAEQIINSYSSISEVVALQFN